MSNKSSIFAPEMEMKKATYQTPVTQYIGEMPEMCLLDISSTIDPSFP